MILSGDQENYDLRESYEFKELSEDEERVILLE